MRLVGDERDIVIVTGCNAVGKTTASNYLRTWATSHHIPYEIPIVADSQCLFEAMQLDDKEGGFHHTHDWCAKDAKSHTHHLGEPNFPFTVIDNELPNRMRMHFFTKLTELPRAGNLWFVEWAGGKNTNPSDDPASCVDYSYAKVKRMLQNGSLPDAWLKRVKAVIHLKAGFSVRLRLNGQRSIPSCAQAEAIEKGTAFWLKDEKVLRFYGKDDFSAIDDLFRHPNIPIYTVENDGGDSFCEHLEIIASAVLKRSSIFSGMVTVTKQSLMYIVSLLLHRKRTRDTKPTEKQVISNEALSVVEKENVPV